MNASNPTMNVSFSLVDDSVFERIEILFADLSFSVDVHPHVILDPASAEVIILDDDGKSMISDSALFDLKQLKQYKFIPIVVPVIGFIKTSYTVNEGDGLVTMMIGVISGDLQIKVPLLITLLSGSANGKSL